jgi:hypothetical protein
VHGREDGLGEGLGDLVEIHFDPFDGLDSLHDLSRIGESARKSNAQRLCHVGKELLFLQCG